MNDQRGAPRPGAPATALHAAAAVAPARLGAALALATAAGALGAQTPQWLPTDGPQPRGYGGVYDARRQRLVQPFDNLGVFEGRRGSWLAVAVDQAPPAVPIARRRHAMVYDSRRGRVVVFGGEAVLPLGDTWAWDGLGWQRVVSVVSPGRRVDAAIAFDSARGVTVLCGGNDTSATPVALAIVDTWELDGDQWRAFPTTPAYGRDPVMTYDEARAECVLAAGGAFHFDGAGWRIGNPQVAATADGAIAYDPVRQVVVLHRRSRQLLEYDGATWRAAAVTPTSISSRPSMHFDPAHGKVVLADLDGPNHWTWDGRRLERITAGGPRWRTTPASLRDDARGVIVVVGLEHDAASTSTWTFDGLTTTRRTPATPLPTSQSAAGVWDSTRNRGLVFLDNGQLWSWDGVDWAFVAGGVTPRLFAHVVYDPVRDRVVVVGGNSGSTPRTDTWEFDGQAWTQVSTTAPFLSLIAAVTFDANRGRPIAFDGLSQPSRTLEWDGAQWLQLSAASPPSSLAFATFDPGRNRTVLCSGLGQWEFDGTAWTQVAGAPPLVNGLGALHVVPGGGWLVHFGLNRGQMLHAVPARVDRPGTACGAPPAVLMADRLPRIGLQDFHLEVAVAAAAPTVLALDATIAATPLGNGCQLWLPQPLVVRQGLAGALGLAAFALPIGSAAVLLGLDVCAQAAALDPNQPGGFVTTQPLRLHLGQ